MTVSTVVINCDDSRVAAAIAPPGARIPVEVRVAVSDPSDAYRRTCRDVGGSFYEAIGGQPGWGTFGADLVERLTADTPTGDDRGDPGIDTAPSLTMPESFIGSETLVRGDCDTPYSCGLSGWLSYDVARELESLPEQAVDDRGPPHLQLGLYNLVTSWMEPRSDDGEMTLRVTCCPAVEVDEDLDATYDEA